MWLDIYPLNPESHQWSLQKWDLLQSIIKATKSPLIHRDPPRINLPMAGQIIETEGRKVVVMVVTASLELFGLPMTVVPTPFTFPWYTLYFRSYVLAQFTGSFRCGLQSRSCQSEFQFELVGRGGTSIDFHWSAICHRSPGMCCGHGQPLFSTFAAKSAAAMPGRCLGPCNLEVWRCAEFKGGTVAANSSALLDTVGGFGWWLAAGYKGPKNHQKFKLIHAWFVWAALDIFTAMPHPSMPVLEYKAWIGTGSLQFLGSD